MRPIDFSSTRFFLSSSSFEYKIARCCIARLGSDVVCNSMHCEWRTYWKSEMNANDVNEKVFAVAAASSSCQLAAWLERAAVVRLSLLLIEDEHKTGLMCAHECGVCVCARNDVLWVCCTIDVLCAHLSRKEMGNYSGLRCVASRRISIRLLWHCKLQMKKRNWLECNRLRCAAERRERQTNPSQVKVFYWPLPLSHAACV